MAISPELWQAKRRSERQLMAKPGVTGVDIGYKEVAGTPTDDLAIRVLVAEKKSENAVPVGQLIPRQIDGFPADVIERRFELHHLATLRPADQDRVDHPGDDFVRGGVGIGSSQSVEGAWYAGTLGVVVADIGSSEVFGLTSLHVLGPDAADLVTPTLVLDGGSSPRVLGALRRQALTSSVDAAIAAIDLPRVATAEILEIGAVTGTATTTIGDEVMKRGRTTGLTFGTVDSVDLSVRIHYGNGIGQRTLTGQIGVRPDGKRSRAFTAPGDTGSVLVNHAREVVGLLFAGTAGGYGVANPIADVLAALDVRLFMAPGRKKLRMQAPSSRPDPPQENENVADRTATSEPATSNERKNQRKDFKDKTEKSERADLKQAKDFPIKEKEKEESKERKEDSDLKHFEDREKYKNEKDQRLEKPNNKDFFKREKSEFEHPLSADVPDSLPLLDALDQRFAVLEAEVAELRHFIDRSLRPDLRHGALTGETDVAPPPEPPGTTAEGSSDP